MALTKSLSFSLGRKRVLISNNSELVDDFEYQMPMKRCCIEEEKEREEEEAVEACRLEALPQEILIKIICGVDHDDIKQLFQVSRKLREATEIAKKMHFAYNTPSRTYPLWNSMDLENAPRPPRSEYRQPMNPKKLLDITVVLFADDATEERWWPRRKKNLFTDAKQED